MGVTVVKTICYNALAGLIKGWPAAYSTADVAKIRPGTFILVNSPVINPLRQQAQTNDYPQLILEYGRRWHFAGDSSTAPFGDQRNFKPVGRPKTLTTWFNLILTHQDLQARVNDPLEQAVLDAIGSAGPTLGIPRSTGIEMVQISDIEGATVEVAAEQETRTMKGARRAETTLSFSVLCRWRQDPSPAVP